MATREFSRVRNRVLVISAAAWSVLLLRPGGTLHCPVTASEMLPLRSSLGMLLAMNPLPSLAQTWTLMLVAMMSPVLIPAILHVRLQSFHDRRHRSVGLFVAGYAVVWLPAGALLLALELSGALFARQLPLIAATAAAATIWQFSPAKQYCLNRSHAYVSLAPFGFAADRDAFCFGVTHATWCVGSCWGLMMWPMLLPEGHVAAMAAVSLFIFSECLEHVAPPRWSCRLSGKLLRRLVAQTRIRLGVRPSTA
jgi:predicted metal-binding membrane protein